MPCNTHIVLEHRTEIIILSKNFISTNIQINFYQSFEYLIKMASVQSMYTHHFAVNDICLGIRPEGSASLWLTLLRNVTNDRSSCFPSPMTHLFYAGSSAEASLSWRLYCLIPCCPGIVVPTAVYLYQHNSLLTRYPRISGLRGIPLLKELHQVVHISVSLLDCVVYSKIVNMSII